MPPGTGLANPGMPGKGPPGPGSDEEIIGLPIITGGGGLLISGGPSC